MLPVVAEPARGVVFEPRVLPPPPRPYPTYEGWILPVATNARHSTSRAVPVEGRPVVRKAVPRTPVKPPAPPVRRMPQAERAKGEERAKGKERSQGEERANDGEPVRDEEPCAEEWRETWLWEVCKEHLRQEA